MIIALIAILTWMGTNVSPQGTAIIALILLFILPPVGLVMISTIFIKLMIGSL